MDKINCHLIIHSRAPHLNQIYAGFLDLSKKNIINLTKEIRIDTAKQILEVIVNDKVKIIYDTMDEEIFYAHSVMGIENIDFYFKRSFNPKVAQQYSFISYPLGLNYNLNTRNGNIFGVKEIIKNKVKKFIKGNKYNFFEEDFEAVPFAHTQPTICFLTRVWDINARDIENEVVRQERIEINQFRIACIQACRDRYKERFIGGIEDSEFARKYYPDFIVKDKTITKKDNYLELIKNTDICIATTGLHKSIGWKFGEYVAASRAIVSEELCYEVPGDFKEGKNYLVFNTVEQLLKTVDDLLVDINKRKNIMWSNYEYYNSYVKAEFIVLNSLTKVIS